MFLVLCCSCLCPIHWSQVLSQEWRCSWSSPDRRCSNYIWVICLLGCDLYWRFDGNSFPCVLVGINGLICEKWNNHVFAFCMILRLLWQVNIGSSNGLLLVRHQAITWANVIPDLCHNMVSIVKIYGFWKIFCFPMFYYEVFDIKTEQYQ